MRKLKGPDRPICSLQERVTVLEALSCVDLVIPFAEQTPCSVLAALEPDVHVKGGDYRKEDLPETPIVEGYGGQIHIVNEFPVHVTDIVRKIRGE